MVENIINPIHEYDRDMTEDEANRVTPPDLLFSKNYTDRETRNIRFDICKSCERILRPTYTCKECLCFMSAKTWLKNAACPLHRW